MAEQYAGFWIRLLAFLLDALIFGVPYVVLNVILVDVAAISSMSAVISISLLLVYASLEGKYGGTPGKLICKIRVQDKNNERIGFANALLRNLAKTASLTIIGIGFMMIAWDSKKQGLHDKFAGTFVVWKS